MRQFLSAFLILRIRLLMENSRFQNIIYQILESYFQFVEEIGWINKEASRIKLLKWSA